MALPACTGGLLVGLYIMQREAFDGSARVIGSTMLPLALLFFARRTDDEKAQPLTIELFILDKHPKVVTVFL